METRRVLESNISDAAAKLATSAGWECIDADSIQEFLNAWYALAEYYRYTDDSDISLFAIKEYRVWMAIFQAHLDKPEQPCSQNLREATGELDTTMEIIIEAVLER